MRRLWDFECKNATCGHGYEDLVSDEERDTQTCPLCGGPVSRLIGTPMFDPKLGLDAGTWPTLGDKWARIRRQRAKIEKRRDEG